MQGHSALVTELEGAILSEIHHRGHNTAFQVRRAFQTSPSIEWSGERRCDLPCDQAAAAARPDPRRSNSGSSIHGSALAHRCGAAGGDRLGLRPRTVEQRGYRPVPAAIGNLGTAVGRAKTLGTPSDGGRDQGQSRLFARLSGRSRRCGGRARRPQRAHSTRPARLDLGTNAQTRYSLWRRLTCDKPICEFLKEPAELVVRHVGQRGVAVVGPPVPDASNQRARASATARFSAASSTAPSITWLPTTQAGVPSDAESAGEVQVAGDFGRLRRVGCARQAGRWQAGGARRRANRADATREQGIVERAIAISGRCLQTGRGGARRRLS